MTAATLTSSAELYEQGLQFFKEGNNERAAEAWLSAADQTSSEDVLKIADGLSALAARYCRGSGRLNEAERIYRRAIELRQTYLAENDASLGIELNNLAMLYQHRAQIDEAIKYLEMSVSILDTHALLPKGNFADPYDNLASLLFDKGDLERARNFCEKALEIRDRTHGRINPLSLKSLELKQDIEEAIKPHSKSARDTRKGI